jgi:hypothetical protein
VKYKIHNVQACEEAGKDNSYPEKKSLRLVNNRNVRAKILKQTLEIYFKKM